MVTNYITCCVCKEELSWEEPKDSTSTALMPDGAFTNAIPGEWVCLDCSYCDECHGDLLEDECLCDVKTTRRGEYNVNMGIGNDTGGLENSNEL